MSDDEQPPCTAFAGPNPTIDKVEADSCIKILLATDNHVGYAESDPVRGRDSINTFREILQLAVANDVDMVLLGGDLFHENRPSRTSLYQTMAALREYTMSSRPITLQVLGDDGIGIARSATWPGVNFEDENMNVGLPVFSIHGNHDDPQGTGAEGALCALDLLSASGFINYFGRLELPGTALDDEEARENGLQVKPVLLQKGDTKLALYGMGNIRDARFHYELNNNRIKLFTPADGAENWFNILLVHQNRAERAGGNHTSDTSFGDETDLVVWGHEHDCIEKACAVPVPGRRYYITQPGSSIATSLAQGESIPKHVSLLKIQGKEFEMEPLRLRSVRPFFWEDISLLEVSEREGVVLDSKIKVTKYLKGRVNLLILKAEEEWKELHPDAGEDEECLLPLIRIRVDYSGGPTEGTAFEVGNPQRFGQDFVDRVANPRDVVQFKRKNAATRRQKVTIDQPELAEEDTEKKESVQVGTLVAKFLQAQSLGVLPEKAMAKAVEDFVDKGDRDALANLLKNALKYERFIIGQNIDTSKDAGDEHDDMEAEMNVAKEAAEAKFGHVVKGKGKKAAAADSDDDVDSMAESRGAGGGRDDDDDSMISSDDIAAKQAKGKAKAAPKKAPVKKAPAKKPATKSKKLMESDEETASDSDASAAPPPKKKPVAPKKLGTVKAPAARKKKPEVVELSTDED